jgi:hypothetical protein
MIKVVGLLLARPLSVMKLVPYRLFEAHFPVAVVQNGPQA